MAALSPDRRPVDRRTALIRSRFPPDAPWPAPLLAFHAGQATEEAALARADTPGRRTEALFQLGVLALAGNPAAARRHWGEVVEHGAPALIEYAAARNELARLGS